MQLEVLLECQTNAVQIFAVRFHLPADEGGTACHPPPPGGLLSLDFPTPELSFPTFQVELHLNVNNIPKETERSLWFGSRFKDLIFQDSITSFYAPSHVVPLAM